MLESHLLWTGFLKGKFLKFNMTRKFELIEGLGKTEKLPKSTEKPKAYPVPTEAEFHIQHQHLLTLAITEQFTELKRELAKNRGNWRISEHALLNRLSDLRLRMDKMDTVQVLFGLAFICKQIRYYHLQNYHTYLSSLLAHAAMCEHLKPNVRSLETKLSEINIQIDREIQEIEKWDRLVSTLNPHAYRNLIAPRAALLLGLLMRRQELINQLISQGGPK